MPRSADRAPVTFGEQIRAAISSLGPLCAGIDPSRALLGAFDLADDADGLLSFGVTCVRALEGVVPVLKPQVAFFERHGASGMGAFEQVVAAARDAGMLVIADAKRGDIGSTTEAYADAWFRGPLAADAVTATPYVGIDALVPMVDAARATRRGLVVVVSSSNPEGRDVQQAVVPGGDTVERAILRAVARWNHEESGETGRLGSVGVVVGATSGAPPEHPEHPEHREHLERAELPEERRLLEDLAGLAGVVLAPGLGAQGASVADVARRFAHCAPGTVLPSASRALLSAGPRGLRSAASRLRDDLAGALP